MSGVVCEYCNAQLASRSSLKIHQTKTKKCLEIQKEKKGNIEVTSYECEYCSKNFTTKGNRDRTSRKL